jgi:glyoxylase-like metal-dependent hydrolase (beta-lactamase superfamily II)
MVEISTIETSTFKLDGGAMFGVVPRVLWSRHYEPDDRNRITIAVRSLLIRHDNRRILIDVGLGNCLDTKFIDIFAIDEPNFQFNEALAQFGETTDSITDVILTHLHFDHAGGLIKAGGFGPELAFPNARIHVQAEQWEWALHPSPKDRASFHGSYLDVLSDCDNLHLIQGRHEITPYITVIPVDGHTPAMQVVLIETANGTAFFPSDLIPTVGHVHIPYLMAFDNQPVIAAAEKTKFLTQAAKENWLIYFQHDAKCQTARVTQKDDKFKLTDDY